MSVGERDHYSGHLTTGHEWNGIKELNTPVPTLLLICLAAAIIFSLGYWFLMPTLPTANGVASGYLGIDQRDSVDAQLSAAKLQRSAWESKMVASKFDKIISDPALMAVVSEAGPALYQDNCALCHGRSGQGAAMFPSLIDSEWLWGDQPESILKTLTVGINARHPQTRIGQMPGFGKGGVLDRQQIAAVATYVRSLTDSAVGSGHHLKELFAVTGGKAVYGTVCAACHGVDAKGNSALGAPNLTDEFWLYGRDQKNLVQTIEQGRAGYMPAWETRLSLAQRKILALFVLQLGKNSVDEP